MTSRSLEERMDALEAEVARLKQRVEGAPPPAAVPWWEKRFGAFENDPLYDEVARLGAEYRRSQPTPADGDGPA